jgi:hypothetical protein
VLLTAEAFGRRVGLRVPSDVVSDARQWLPYWWRDADVEPEREWDVPSAAAAEYAIGELELWVGEYAADLIFVHAGVVSLNGRALLLPGRSFSGKTTLTVALLRAGATYGSDEYAVLDADGRVRPYPRPLAIRGDGFLRSRVPAADLGAATFTDPIPVAAVAELRYVAGSAYEVEPLSPGRAVLRLFDNTLCAQSRAEAALDALVATTSGARAIAGVRGDVEQAVAPLLELLNAADHQPD